MLLRTRSLSLTAAGAVMVGAVAAGAGASTARSDAARPGGSRQDGFKVARLVADRPGQATLRDPSLVNPWGLAAGPSTPLWVSNNGTATSTLYQGAVRGTPVSKVPLEVTLPDGGDPTGVAFNPTQDFVLSKKGKTGPASFIFAGENGDIFAWNRTGDPNFAVRVAHVRNAVFKGISLVSSGGKNFLVVTDFHHARVDVFDSSFHRVSARAAFRSVRIPRGYAPFGVATLRGLVYVTYAKQDAARHDDVAGPGHGFINVFNQNGRFLRSLVRRGALDSPWGLTVAPRGFGRFGGDLLVGNFGNGRIHVVGLRSGKVMATLATRRHRPIVIDGLWGLLPGNGVAGGRSQVWFSAGPNDESHGLLGLLSARHRHG